MPLASSGVSAAVLNGQKRYPRAHTKGRWRYESIGGKNSNGNSRKISRSRAPPECSSGLFIERGYANTRMEDIATSMQMSRSSLYYYYENKEQVLLALTQGDLQVATDTLEAF